MDDQAGRDKHRINLLAGFLFRGHFRVVTQAFEEFRQLERQAPQISWHFVIHTQLVAVLESQPMNIYMDKANVRVGVGMVRQPVRGLIMRPTLLDWLTVHDLEALREALVKGSLPPDFLTKLQFLAGGDLGHRFIEQNCRLFAELLLAVEKGSFQDIKPIEHERLLRVLAYVRKEDDAIPDRLAGGFADDQREILAATTELRTLLQNFKAWRLRRQVPSMWANSEVSRLQV